MEDDPSTRARRVYHMGNLLQKRGEVKEAAKMYRSAVKLDPAHKASHYNLGASCVALVRLDHAVKYMDYCRLLRLDCRLTTNLVASCVWLGSNTCLAWFEYVTRLLL